MRTAHPNIFLSKFMCNRLVVFISMEILPRKAVATFGVSWATSYPAAGFTKGPARGGVDQKPSRQTHQQCSKKQNATKLSRGCKSYLFISIGAFLKSRKGQKKSTSTLVILSTFLSMFSWVCPVSPWGAQACTPTGVPKFPPSICLLV